MGQTDVLVLNDGLRLSVSQIVYKFLLVTRGSVSVVRVP